MGRATATRANKGTRELAVGDTSTTTLSMKHSNKLVMMALGFAPTALATELVGGNITAMGGAAVAHPSDNAAVTVNPGMLGITKRYDVGALFAYGPTQDLFWGLSVVDSHTNDIITFGVAYAGSKANPAFRVDELPGWTPEGVTQTNYRDEHVFTVAVNKPLWDRRIGLGLSGTVSSYNHEHTGKGATGNMDIGFGIQPIEYISIGLAGENILPVANQASTPATFRAGFHAQYKEFVAGSFDFRYQTEEVYGVAYHIGAGLEGGFKGVRARIGYRWEGVFQNHGVTWGLGLENEAGAIEYAMLAPIGGSGTDLVHTISLRVKAGGIKDMVDDMDKEMGVNR